MKKSIVFAGFSLPKYVEVARQLFPQTSYDLVCIYGREPNEAKRNNFLPLFDKVYHIDTLPPELLDSVEVVTCTQERDTETYIDLLTRLQSISKEQNRLWKRAVNKKLFKETMCHLHPELVPAVSSFLDTPEFINKISYPAVIKPTNMTGSSFVSVIRNRQELTTYLENISKYDSIIKNLGRSPELVIEEFVSGPQYSMNVYIDKNGIVHYCPIIRVVPAFELGQDDTYSALQYNTDLPETQLQSLHSAIENITSTFKLSNTSAHFDCILSDSGWKICEVGLRIGGNRQTLFQLSHNFNHFKNDLLNRLGKQVEQGIRQKTVVVVHKAPQTKAYLKKVNYREPTDPDVNIFIDKIKENDPDAGPVKTGGVIAFRAFLSGYDEQVTLKQATELYSLVEFETKVG